MINLPVSEAYAFDYLAILLVKMIVPLPTAAEEAEKCRDSIRKQIGEDMILEIIGSPEFGSLVSANKAVWNLVGKAAKDECKASEVDQANQRRYEAKKALQSRFWPDKPLAEVKAERPT